MKPKESRIGIFVWAMALVGLGVVCFSAYEPAFSQDKAPPQENLYYIVRQGDCLWDISDRFYRTPWVYPKVWRNNAYIANPHWIYPGDLILLAHVPGAEGGAKPAAEGVQAAPGSPEGAKTIRISRSVADTALLSQDGISGSGRVLASKDGRILSSQADEIFLQVPGLQEPVPSSYQILKKIREVDHPLTLSRVGVLYGIAGSAEILRAYEDGMVRARILDSRDPVEVGDILRPGSPPPEAFYSKRASTPIKGNVVAGLRVSEELAQHDICFIDKGVLDGVELGDTFWVFESGRKVPGSEPGEVVGLPDIKVALLVVVHAEKNTSTALVTESQSSFRVGAPVRAWVN